MSRDLTRWNVSVWRTSDWQLERSAPLTPFYDAGLTLWRADLVVDLSLAALSEPDLSGWDGALWRLERFADELLGPQSPLPVSPTPTQVVVRRLKDGKLIAKLPRFGREVWDCVFSPDGRYLAVSHDGDTIALWEWKGIKG